MKYKNIFWGVMFICIGGLFLLKNLNLVYFTWESLLHLWPLLIVLWGISLLPIKSWMRLAFSFLAILAGVLLYNQDIPNNRNHFRFHFEDRAEHDSKDKVLPLDQEFSEELDDSTKGAILKLDAVVGDYNIYGGSKNLIDFKRSGDIGSYSFTTSKMDDGRKKVKIRMNENRHDRLKYKNKVNIDLNNDIVWDCDFDFGAADIYADLSRVIVKEINLDGAASNTDIKLGMKYQEVKIDIDAAVANFTLRIPKEAGCRIESDGFLANKDLKGFVKKSKGNFETKNYQTAKVNLFVTLDAAITNLEIIRY